MPLISARARAFAMSAVLAIASIGLIGPMQATAAGPTNWHVQVGAGDPTSPTEVDRFYPSALTVHPGDTVDFAWGGFHTVTFNPVPAPIFAYLGGPGGLSAPGPLATPTTFVTALPDFSNPAGPPDFILSISMSLPSGTYHYQCMLHKVMQATLRVTRGEIERTDAQNMALAAKHMAEDVEALNRFDSRLSRRSGEESVLAGAGQGALSSLKFYPSSNTIRSGERVNFTNADPNEVHTVSFGFANPGLRPPGEAYPSSPSPATFSGGDLNSGYLMSRSNFNFWHLAGALPGYNPISHYAVTFKNTDSVAHTYLYYCAIHGGISPDGLQVFGMTGSITVLPAQRDH